MTVPTLGVGYALPLLTTTGIFVIVSPLPAYGENASRFELLSAPR